LGYVEKRQEFRPESGEAPFESGEIFFSRTNKRGIIQSGNYIFRRVAHYEWDQLLGGPHKLIRHPDMPKGVFQLFWDTLNRGETIGAYVKNKAKDGLHYWVFAVAMPFHDGFLSVRIKPSSDVLEIIDAEYANLLLAEQKDGIKPSESAKILLERINALGFADYTSFESHCLMRELAARDKAIGNPVSPYIVMFDEMMRLASELKQATADISQKFEEVSVVPTNLRIIAARLEPSGGAVSSLAQNYWAMSEEMSEWFNANVNDDDSDFAKIHETLNSCRFLFGTAGILSTMSTEYNMERRSLGGLDLDLEKKQINELQKQYISKALGGVDNVLDVTRQIIASVGIMRRYTLGLSSTRVMCNIESARLVEGGQSLNDVIAQLGTFQQNMEDMLEKIEGLSQGISNLAFDLHNEHVA